jgi:hypothetical protein
MADIPRVKSNIGKMIDQGAPEADIDAYLASEGVSLDQLQGPKGFVANAMDFAKSIPRGIVSGLTSAPNPSMVPIEDEQAAVAPTRQAATATLKAPLPEPQGPAGKVGEAVGEGLGNPVSYLGPGGALLKTGGAALSSAASEVAGQATEGTWYEKPARLVAALTGGVAAGKAFGPSAPKAAIPTSKELLDAGSAGYKQARNSGLELKPDAASGWAAKLEQELAGPDYGFTGGAEGTAKQTFGVLSKLQAPPGEAVAISASNLDTLRKQLQLIAEEVKPAAVPGGMPKPTADAAAATIALKRLNAFTEDIPTSAVLAGDPSDYVRATKQANADWGAGQRTRDFDARLNKAENATDRQVAGSLDSQIKTKAGQLLDNPHKTGNLSKEELAQLQLINSGDLKSNILRQLGRGGAGVIPLMAQAATAVPLAAATGGLSVIPQAMLAATLYGARKGSEAITKSRANKLAEMLAKRSPEYERRTANLPAADSSPQTAAILRALLAQ